jgi:pyruvate kinase
LDILDKPIRDSGIHSLLISRFESVEGSGDINISRLITIANKESVAA